MCAYNNSSQKVHSVSAGSPDLDKSLSHICKMSSFQFENPSSYKDKVIATGLPASPGAAVGQVVFSANDAEEWHAQGKSVILVDSNYKLVFFIPLLSVIDN